MANFIMSGPWQALGFVVLIASLSSFIPLVGILDNAAIGLITLRLGWRYGLRIAFGAAVIIALLAWLLTQQLGLSGFGANVLEWGFIIVLAMLLTITASWRYVLYSVYGLAAFSVIVFHLLVPDAALFWQSTLNAVSNLTQLQQQFPELAVNTLIPQVAPYMTGAFAAALGLIVTLSLMLARHWQAQLYNVGGFQEEIRQLRLGKAPALGLLVLIIINLFRPSPLLVDLLTIGASLFFFQGIALVHGLRLNLGLQPAWLLLLYIPLLILPVHMALLLTAFGVIDSFADFRSTITQKAKPD